jgi:hypothetical protein
MAPPDKQAAAMMMMMMMMMLYITVILSVQAKNLTSRRREDFQLHQHTQKILQCSILLLQLILQQLGVRKSPLCFFRIWSMKGGRLPPGSKLVSEL